MFARRSRRTKSTSRSPRVLRCEQLESRTVLSAIPLSDLHLLAPVKTPAATPPTIVKAASANVNSAGVITGTSAALVALGNDAQGASTLIYNWAVTSVPGGGGARFSANGTNAAQNDTVTFTEAGLYGLTVTIVNKSGLSVTSGVKVMVVQTVAGISLYSGSAKTLVNSGTQLTVTGTSQTLAAMGVDQFGYPMAVQPSCTWTATTYPSGAKPSLASASGLETVTFSKAGAYGVTVSAGGQSVLANILVNQTLTSILVTPNTVSIPGGATQQFKAQGLDQFQQAMATAPTFTWTAGGGTISSAGLFTAPGTVGTDSIAAKSGSISGTASATVTSPTPAPSPSPTPSPTPAPSPSPNPAISALKDPGLASLVQQLDAGGSLNRADMIQILTSVGAGGSVSATDFADLKTILADAAQFNMPNYVQVLSSDVVNGNPANATYQGAALGNLAAGSSKTQLTDLIDKWFYGTDLPTLTSTAFTYTTASGSLFPVTPSVNDEYQGQLGDCYFISSLGTIADTNPAAIENMFINNGDGTYTVRFYTGAYAAYYAANGTISDGFLNNLCDGRLRDRQSLAAELLQRPVGLCRLRIQGFQPGQLALDPAGGKGLCPVERDRQRRPQRPEFLRRDGGRLDGHGQRPGARAQCHRLQSLGLDRAGDDHRSGLKSGGDHRHQRQQRDERPVCRSRLRGDRLQRGDRTVQPL